MNDTPSPDERIYGLLAVAEEQQKSIEAQIVRLKMEAHSIARDSATAAVAATVAALEDAPKLVSAQAARIAASAAEIRTSAAEIEAQAAGLARLLTWRVVAVVVAALAIVGAVAGALVWVTHSHLGALRDEIQIMEKRIADLDQQAADREKRRR